MMSTLVCTQCGQVAVETSRSVVLPFVCVGCQDGSNVLPHSMTQPVAGDDHDAASNYQTTVIQERSQVDELSDDTATTEATLELITDLESQLSLAKELSQGQTQLIEQLEKQIETLTSEKVNDGKELDEDLEIIEQLAGAMRLISDTHVARTKELEERADALAFYLGFHAAKATMLEKENELLRAGLDHLASFTGVKVHIIAKG